METNDAESTARQVTMSLENSTATNTQTNTQTARSAVSPRRRFSKHKTKMLANVERIRNPLKQLTAGQLVNGFNDLRVKVQSSNRDMEALADEAMAFAKEATFRVLGMELYDVQLLAGSALINKKIAEMQTGEGKTISAIPGAVYGGMFGAGVHVATPNSYLAERDYEELKEVYSAIGLSIGLLPSGEGPSDPSLTKAAYDCDITYGTGYEFGFDYLRDQLILKKQKQLPFGQQMLDNLKGKTGEPLSQRGLGFSIVDEADNVLIDDATSPQVLSEFQSGDAPDTNAVKLARLVAMQLEKGIHFREPSPGAVELTPEGQIHVHRNDLAIPTRELIRPWKGYIEAALRAEHHFIRNVEYVIGEEGVRIVDQSTGRIFEDRSWQAGLHQAVEAKEGLSISPESLPLATITRQRFYRLYQSMAGMTGTTQCCIGEFKTIYRLGVETIPLRKPSLRQMLPMRVFDSAERKWEAIQKSVVEFQSKGQPVLIGTRTIEESQTLANLLDQVNLGYELLNGTQDADEAELVSRAGLAGAVTIATNLAGRGTNIKMPPEVLDNGGLHVVVSECHASFRVDRQLIGRCARQGQPGSCQVFVSADDWLLETHADWLSETIRKIATGGELHTNIESSIRDLQTRLEREQFANRLELLRSNERQNDIILGLN